MTENQKTTIIAPVLWDQMETAKYLGVSHKWLERDRWEGPQIPYLKIGRAVRYRSGDVVQFLEDNFVSAKQGEA